MPSVLRMTPEKVCAAALSPIARVMVPATELSTAPEPAKPLIVSLKPARSSVPAAPMVTLPEAAIPMPFGMTLAAPRRSVPEPTFVPPV